MTSPVLGEELWTFSEREAFLASGAQQKILRAARGSSKTHSCVAQLVLGNPDKGLYGLLAPNPNIHVEQTAVYMTKAGSQAKDVVWSLVMSYLPEEFVMSASKHTGEIKLATGTRLLIKGYDRHDLLQGLTVSLGVVYDEAQALDQERWSQIDQIRKRDGMRGWSIMAGRPAIGNEGIGCFFHRQEQQYQRNADLGSLDYEVFTYDCTAAYDPVEIAKEIEQGGMAPDAILREFFAEWTADSKSAFYLFGDHCQLLPSLHTYDPERPVGFSFDFNVVETGLIVWQPFEREIVHARCYSKACRRTMNGFGDLSQYDASFKSGDTCPHCARPLPTMTSMAVIDEMMLDRGDTHEQAEWMMQWLAEHGHSRRAKVLIGGDASGNHGSTTDRFAADWEVVKRALRGQYPIKHFSRSANQRVRDSLVRTNGLFADSEEMPPRILIDFSRCQNLVRELRMAERDPKGGLAKSKSAMLNLVDALRYGAEDLFNLRQDRRVPLTITSL